MQQNKNSLQQNKNSLTLGHVKYFLFVCFVKVIVTLRPTDWDLKNEIVLKFYTCRGIDLKRKIAFLGSA